MLSFLLMHLVIGIMIIMTTTPASVAQPNYASIDPLMPTCCHKRISEPMIWKGADQIIWMYLSSHGMRITYVVASWNF